MHMKIFFFFNDTATTEIYTLSLHDALPISADGPGRRVEPCGDQLHQRLRDRPVGVRVADEDAAAPLARAQERERALQDQDRKSTRLNSSHANISYAVFCLKKKNQTLALFDS